MMEDRTTAGYQGWLDGQDVASLSNDDLLTYWELSNRFGSANCWAGTTGALAIAIRRLLCEVERLRKSKD